VTERIDAPRARRMLRRHAQLADVLPASIYAQEHLPGARSLPLEELDRTAAEQFDRAKPLVVYCFDQH
jgi:rhodanese-related sulfurtransferase